MDLKDEVAGLETLRGREPTPQRLAQVTAALESKFEGVQAVAVRVLAAWGDAKSLMAARRFLESTIDRKYGWSVRGVAVQALAPTIQQGDADWVLGLCFQRPDQLLMHELLPLVLRLPVDAARRRLEAELKSPRWMNRQAAVKAIGNMPFPDRAVLLSRLIDDPNKTVRASARALLR
jgi:HEAT repeat protein